MTIKITGLVVVNYLTHWAVVETYETENQCYQREIDTRATEAEATELMEKFKSGTKTNSIGAIN